MDERSARLLARLEKKVARLQATGADTFLSLTGLVLTATSALYFTSASGRIIPGATALVIRNNADTVTNFTISNAGGATLLGALSINNGGSDAESAIRRDNASSALSSSSAIFSLTNRDPTDNNWLVVRFSGVDSGLSARNTAFIGVQMITHGASFVTSNVTFQTANASATPATRLILGTLGEGADIRGSSSILVSATGKSVLKLMSTATNDDPTEDFTQGRVPVTNNTQTTIETIPTTTSTVLMVETTVVARQTSASGAGTVGNGAAWVVRGTYRNVAGTVTLIGAVTAVYTAEDEAGWDATLTISGTNVLVRITGATNEGAVFHSHTRTWQVGT